MSRNHNPISPSISQNPESRRDGLIPRLHGIAQETEQGRAGEDMRCQAPHPAKNASLQRTGTVEIIAGLENP